MEEEKITAEKMRNIHAGGRGIIRVIFAVFLFAVSLVAPSAVRAASLFFSPAGGTYKVGQSFTVNVLVKSPDQAMNATDGVISFSDSGIVDVTSISKVGSIINLWVREPSFSNSSRTVSFEGVVLNPGYLGAGAKVISITFKAKSEGVATVKFNSGSILANDGLGTNLVEAFSGAEFNIVEGGEQSPATPVAGKVPAAPEVSSPTHPNPEVWYNNKNPEFKWTMPSGISGVNVLANREATADPGTRSDGLMTSYDYTNVDDGVWYFHVKLKNSAGWGATAHFRFRIDSKPPEEFAIKEIPRVDLTDPNAKFEFLAKDSGSGIDHYEVRFDGAGEPQIWKDDGKHIYAAPALNPGKHLLSAKAVDAAGNYLEGSAEFEIGALQPPIITEYPRTIAVGKTIVIRGTTYPNAKVALRITEAASLDPSATSDNFGNFTISVSEKLAEGSYRMSAEVVASNGAKSLPSETITVTVEQSWLKKVGMETLNFLAFFVPILLLLLALVFLIWYMWHKFMLLRKRLSRDTREAENRLHKAIDFIKDDMQRHIRSLERVRNQRDLTLAENRILDRLRKNLDRVDKLINKEIGDIKDKTK